MFQSFCLNSPLAFQITATTCSHSVETNEAATCIWNDYRKKCTFIWVNYCFFKHKHSI